MIKRILTYLGFAILILIASLGIHQTAASALELTFPFRLRDVYFFQAIASLLLVVTFELLSSLTQEFKDQLGFLYLGSMMLKILLFCIVFRNVLFTAYPLSKTDSLSLLIPIFLFLFYEVFFIAKILNKQA